MSYYQSVKSTILTKPADLHSGQIEGIVCIHPSAEIHPDAKIGPNVTIGAEVKVGEGARIVDIAYAFMRRLGTCPPPPRPGA